MYTEKEAKAIAENNLEGYTCTDAELFGDEYMCRMVPASAQGNANQMPLDSVFFTVNSNTGEFKVRNMDELHSVVSGGDMQDE